LLVAKALVHDPEIIILDEPTAGVDVELRQNLWTYIRKLNNIGKTICLTTHYLEEAEYLCDYITIINKGKILKSDTKNNLLELLGIKTVSFNINKKYNIPNELKKYEAKMLNDKLILNYDKKHINLSEIITILNKNQITFSEINTQESNLEDVFLNLINQDD